MDGDQERPQDVSRVPPGEGPCCLCCQPDPVPGEEESQHQGQQGEAGVLHGGCELGGEAPPSGSSIAGDHGPRRSPSL